MAEASEDPVLTQFTDQDLQVLIQAISDEEQVINWEHLSQREGFSRKFSAQECLLQFLKMPISESLLIDFETKTKKLQRPID
jgi:flagellar motor switch protein FliG